MLHTPPPRPKSSPFLQAALAYAKLGWPVLRLERQGKRPAMGKHWPAKATTDPALIRHLWGAQPEANVGLVTGKASGLFVIDADGPHTPNLSLAKGARLVGIARTGRGRHWVFWDPEIADQPSRKLDERTDLLANGRQFVAPPSVHPSGAEYTWLVWYGLDGKGGGGMAAGRWVVGNRNTHLTSVTGNWRAKGATKAELKAKATVYNAEQIDPLGDDEVTKVAESVARYEPIGTTNGRTTRPSALTTALYAAMEATTWRGTRGASARALLAILVGVAGRVGEIDGDGLVFRCSSRQASVLANIGLPAVTGALHLLMHQGWLRRLKRGWGAHSSLWRLAVPAVSENNNNQTTGRGVLRTPLLLFGGYVAQHDCFTWGGGLGVNSALVLAALSQQPGVRIVALASTLNMTRGTVTRCLKRMAEQGLVTHAGRRWYAVDDPDLVATSYEMGVLGRRKKKTKRYQEDRDQYRRWLLWCVGEGEVALAMKDDIGGWTPRRKVHAVVQQE